MKVHNKICVISLKEWIKLNRIEKSFTARAHFATKSANTYIYTIEQRMKSRSDGGT